VPAPEDMATFEQLSQPQSPEIQWAPGQVDFLVRTGPGCELRKWEEFVGDYGDYDDWCCDDNPCILDGLLNDSYDSSEVYREGGRGKSSSRS